LRRFKPRKCLGEIFPSFQNHEKMNDDSVDTSEMSPQDIEELHRSQETEAEMEYWQKQMDGKVNDHDCQ